MDDEIRMKSGKDIIDTLISLTNTINDAGGAVLLEILLSMPLSEFIVKIAAPNHIRFYKERSQNV